MGFKFEQLPELPIREAGPFGGLGESGRRRCLVKLWVSDIWGVSLLTWVNVWLGEEDDSSLREDELQERKDREDEL